MKHVEKHISKLLVSIAIFVVFGNLAFAGETFEEKEKALIISEIQEDGHDKPFEFHEISIGEASQTISQNEYLGFGFGGMFHAAQIFSSSFSSTKNNASYSLEDKRELISRYLFPYHFFW